MNKSFITKLFICLMMIMTTASCKGTDTARWTEEVRSWDGSVFQLEGRGEIGSNGWPTAHRGTIRYVEYYHRQTGAYWRSPGGYEPVIFDLIKGDPYVVILVYNVTTCYLTNYPDEGLLIYRWNKVSGWNPVNVSELSSNLEFNLLQNVFNSRDKKDDVQGFVPLSIKRHRDLGDGSGEFKRWREEYGGYCKKQKERGVKVKTDERIPSFIGFHGQPKF